VRLAVLASGTGTNLQAIIDACEAGTINAQVVAVISDRRDAMALERARRHGIDAIWVGRAQGESRRDHGTRLADAVTDADAGLVVLAGYMRLLPMTFLDRFPRRVVNLHPALPGELPGVDAIARAYAEWVAGARTHSGVMVHLVIDEGVDDGPVLAKRRVEFATDDTMETFAARMHAVEHAVLVETLRRLCTDGSDPSPLSPRERAGGEGVLPSGHGQGVRAFSPSDTGSG
jgi:formyltetrahydrofolate-dependent phosphoribosylglycinamide formyltransferase